MLRYDSDIVADLDKFIYGPPDAITQEELRALLPTGGFYLSKNSPPTTWNKTVTVNSVNDMALAVKPITTGHGYLYAAGGIFVDDSAPTFVFESTDWNTPSTAISAQSVLNQVLLNTTIAASSGELQTPYVPNDFQQGIIAVFMVLGFAIYPGFFSLYPTAERLRNVRAMQYSNGERLCTKS
jgi:hypothetical protein